MNPNRLPASLLAAALFGSVLLVTPPIHADYASAVTALNPITYYRFSATNLVPAELPAVNAGSLGATFNGEYQAMPASRGMPGAIAGDADTAVSIVGSAGQQVVVPFSAAYNPNGPFTVEFWAKPANIDGVNHTVAISMVNGQNPANGDDRSGWCVRHSGADWQVLLGYDHSDGATFYGTTSTASGTVTAGAWQHVVAVYSGAAVTLYVNGTEAATSPPAFPMLPNSAAPLILGDRGYTGWDYNGLVDEFAIYTSALSAADIQAHYNNGLNAARTKPYPGPRAREEPGALPAAGRAFPAAASRQEQRQPRRRRRRALPRRHDARRCPGPRCPPSPASKPPTSPRASTASEDRSRSRGSTSTPTR